MFGIVWLNTSADWKTLKAEVASKYSQNRTEQEQTQGSKHEGDHGRHTTDHRAPTKTNYI